MRRSVAYALLIAAPPAFAGGSGVLLLTERPLVGVGFGALFGIVLFVIMVLGSEYGTTDDRSVGEL